MKILMWKECQNQHHQYDENSDVESLAKTSSPIVPNLLNNKVEFVSSIMYIPLQCATLTALYTTLTQLYTDLLLSSLIRYISDHPVYSKCKTALAIRQLSDLPSEVQEQVWKLSQL